MSIYQLLAVTFVLSLTFVPLALLGGAVLIGRMASWFSQPAKVRALPVGRAGSVGVPSSRPVNAF
jgi:hypothetical protein